MLADSETHARLNASRLRRVILPACLLVGDTMVAFAGLAAGYGLRYHSSLGRFGLEVPNANFVDYLPLLLVGVAFLIGAYAHLSLYEERHLLRKFQSLNLIIKGTTFWLAAYLSLSLVLKFDPPISRLFVVISFGCVIALMFAWRNLFHFLAIHSRWRERLRQQVAILGWNAEAVALSSELEANSAHPYRFCGVIALPEETSVPHQLGMLSELPALLARHQIDVLIATRTDLPREQLLEVIDACERTYVEWKVVPNSFQILLSGLRLQTIGRLPVLGIEDLAITKLFNRFLKRGVDLVGAGIFLIVSSPLLLVLVALIKRESPGAPVIFRQVRVGSGHRNFTLYKLRSMQPDAAQSDHLAQSTAANDPRLLKLGGFLRRWNLDELPQLWNVLRGEMSLVGPRPERPYHVEQLAHAIPHYLPRHLVKPGMTGWAQVNGLRGATSMEQRIQHDIYYIENWSLWLDLQILGLTLVRWKNPEQ